MSGQPFRFECDEEVGALETERESGLNWWRIFKAPIPLHRQHMVRRPHGSAKPVVDQKFSRTIGKKAYGYKFE